MTDVFTYVVNEIIREEGGFVNDSQDPGGATNMGITIATLGLWRNTKCTEDDVRDLTSDEAVKIYKALYWDKVHGDELPPAKALIMFDAAVNQGVGTSIKLAQRALGVIEDGVIGPQTLNSLKKGDQREFVINFLAARTVYYVGLPGWIHDGKGWSRRLFNICLDASGFIQNN